MGTVVTASCEHCKYRQEFHLGGGLGGVSLERYLHLLPEQEREVLLAMKQEEKIHRLEIGNRLVCCETCREDGLYQKTVFCITDRGGTKQVFGIRCARCGGELQSYGEAKTLEAQLPCPQCGRQFLTFQRTGLWD